MSSTENLEQSNNPIEEIKSNITITPNLSYNEAEIIVNALAMQQFAKVAPLINKIQILVTEAIAAEKKKIMSQK